MTKIQLPEPAKTGGMPLMDAINRRASVKTFSDREIPLQIISDLLYAAGGINRADGHLTTPTANDSRNMALYVVTPEAVYRYNRAGHALEEAVRGDFRADTGCQDYVETAYLQIVVLMDEAAGNERFFASPMEKRVNMSYEHAGHISQNLYLVCMANGLNAVARIFIDHARLRKALKLDENLRIILAQTIGYPA